MQRLQSPLQAASSIRTLTDPFPNFWNEQPHQPFKIDRPLTICPNFIPKRQPTKEPLPRTSASRITSMQPRFSSQLLAKLRRRSSAVSGIVLLCLVGQSLLPGVTSVLATSTEPSEVAGCCVVDLSRAASSGCCCGPTAAESCGCACGTKKTSASEIRNTKQPPAKQGRTIQSEICGCGGKHRAGMITSIEPAVLPALDAPLYELAAPQLPDAFCDWSCRIVPPPTPPPEFCV